MGLQRSGEEFLDWGSGSSFITERIYGRTILQTGKSHWGTQAHFLNIFSIEVCI